MATGGMWKLVLMVGGIGVAVGAVLMAVLCGIIAWGV